MVIKKGTSGKAPTVESRQDPEKSSGKRRDDRGCEHLDFFRSACGRLRDVFFSGAAFAAYHSVDAPCPFKKRDPFYLGLGGLGLGLVADTSYAPRGIVSRVVSWCSCEERVFCFVFFGVQTLRVLLFPMLLLQYAE